MEMQQIIALEQRLSEVRYEIVKLSKYKGNNYNPDVINITFKEGKRITDYAKVIANKTNNSYEEIEYPSELSEIEDYEIIEEKNNILTIEITSKNKFEITQRIMSHSMKCKVLYPQDYKEHIISTLKRMKEGYFGK